MVKRLKLNEKTVREAENVGRDYQTFDTDVRGVSITIYPSGNRAFTFDYRVAGRRRRMTIGRWTKWSTTAARGLRRDFPFGGFLNEEYSGAVNLSSSRIERLDLANAGIAIP